MLTVKQVEPEYVRTHLSNKSLYRICKFDDSRKLDGSHFSTRIKAVSALSVEDVVSEFDSTQFAYIEVYDN